MAHETQAEPTMAEMMAEIKRLQEIATLQVKPFWNIDEASKMLGYSKYYLRRMVANHEIPCYKPNRNKVFFDPKELVEWVKTHRVETIEKTNAATLLERYINS